jgi:hypothetical protein
MQGAGDVVFKRTQGCASLTLGFGILALPGPLGANLNIFCCSLIVASRIRNPKLLFPSQSAEPSENNSK